MRALKTGSAVGVAGALGWAASFFAPGARAARGDRAADLSTSLHGFAVAPILFIASLGLAAADERTEPIRKRSRPGWCSSRSRAWGRRWRRRIENENAPAARGA